MSLGRLELASGARLDRYELLCPLAEGGMATVWLARLRGKRGFEQLVAIKTMKAHLTEDLRFEQMFLDEARLASRIRHPNVAQITDLGEEEDVLYLVMEWVDGDSVSRLRRHLVQQKIDLPIAISLRIVADLAAGLHAAHELNDESGANLGVIHRDISPQNVLVSTTGSVKVIDFGIAKARNRAVAETTDGLLKGKVAYMSPEQAKGLPLDRRTDVWAAGVCLYELLTGALPFDGDSQQEIHRLLVGNTPVPALPETVPAVVRAIVTQALARDVDERFHSAAALERAIEGALAILGHPTTNDDLATFLRETCGSRAKKRREMVAKAVERLDRAGGPGDVDSDDRARGDRSSSLGEPTTDPLDERRTDDLPGANTSSVDVRFSAPPIEHPTSVDAQVATLHSTSMETPVGTRATSSWRRVTAIAMVVAIGLGIGGYVIVLRMTGTGARTTTLAPPPPVTVPDTAASASPHVDSPPPSASTTHATTKLAPLPSAAPISMTPPTANATAKVAAPSPAKTAPRAPTRAVPRPSAPASPQFDPDGIPIAPKGGSP